MATARSSAAAGRAARRSSDVVIFLHGFASSGHSGKASYFAGKFRERGIEYGAPDLNLPDFSTLPITRMLEQTRALIENMSGRSPGPVTLIGSSLGAVVGGTPAGKWPGGVRPPGPAAAA